MASISEINGKWRAQIRRKGFKSTSRWFDTKAKAVKWSKSIEDQMDGKGPVLVQEKTIGDLIKQYVVLRSKTRPISDSSTEHYTLRQLAANLGKHVASRLTVDDLLGWALKRKDDGAGAYTVNCDLSKLSTVLRYAGDGLPDVVGAARPKLTYLGLIGGGGMRDRRPTDDEIERLRQHFLEVHGQKYVDAIDFAGTTAMRRGEICAIKFEDIDESKRLIKVMRKHPRKGKTLEWVPLLPKPWEIVQSRPRDSELIFPIHPQTLTKYWTEACKMLGIPDLHLHDLRHEGTSALFEGGMPIQKVALVTGHKKWETLRRYTNLRPESVHEQSLGIGPHLDSHKIAFPHPHKSEP